MKWKRFSAGAYGETETRFRILKERRFRILKESKRQGSYDCWVLYDTRKGLKNCPSWECESLKEAQELAETMVQCILKEL